MPSQLERNDNLPILHHSVYGLVGDNPSGSRSCRGRKGYVNIDPEERQTIPFSKQLAECYECGQRIEQVVDHG